ncbi:MAG: AtpZ/AtpI family protein [Flammeovirgaceae bacterium]|nr:AtpZ/AtpI family protein [Flammeovirgaceae bacterium]
MEQGPSNKKEPKPYNKYLKYSSVGLQLFLSLGIAAWLGYELDDYLNNKFPAFLLSFVMIVFVGMIYQLLKSINKDF